MGCKKKLVDQPEYGTNHGYLFDFIPITHTLRQINVGKIRRLFEENGRSASQIAEEYGVSKSFVLSVLHKSGLKLGTKVGRSTNPKNYRNASPPYGYAIRKGQLVTYKPELRVCRLVVELRARRGMSSTAIAEELCKRGYKNRAGRAVWNPTTVLNIFRRWNGKL